MAIKKADAITASAMLQRAEIAAAEARIDEAIQKRYLVGEKLVFRLDTLVSTEQSCEILTQLYFAGGWNVRRGWHGSQDDGYSTLELS